MWVNPHRLLCLLLGMIHTWWEHDPPLMDCTDTIRKWEKEAIKLKINQDALDTLAGTSWIGCELWGRNWIWEVEEGKGIWADLKRLGWGKASSSRVIWAERSAEIELAPDNEEADCPRCGMLRGRGRKYNWRHWPGHMSGDLEGEDDDVTAGTVHTRCPSEAWQEQS